MKLFIETDPNDSDFGDNDDDYTDDDHSSSNADNALTMDDPVDLDIV